MKDFASGRLLEDAEDVKVGKVAEEIDRLVSVRRSSPVNQSGNPLLVCILLTFPREKQKLRNQQGTKR